MNKDSALPQTISIDGVSETVGGLTKREFFAIEAFKAITGNHQLLVSLDKDNGAIQLSVNVADTLIAKLAEKTNG